MDTLAEANDIQIEERQPGTWRDAFLAGLPHLLMGLLIWSDRFGIYYMQDVSNLGNVIVSLGLALLVIGVLLYAWRRGWPLWSASWVLYGSWGFLIALGLLIRNLNLEESWRYTNALFLGWVLLCIVGYFVIVFRSRLHGLLSVAFLFPMLGVSMLEFVPNPIEGWLGLGVALAAALAAGAIVRVGRFRLALGLVLGFNLAVGMALAYVAEYKMLDPPSGIPARIPDFGRFLDKLALYVILGLGTIALPLILRHLWNFGRRRLAS